MPCPFCRESSHDILDFCEQMETVKLDRTADFMRSVEIILSEIYEFEPPTTGWMIERLEDIHSALPTHYLKYIAMTQFRLTDFNEHSFLNRRWLFMMIANTILGDIETYRPPRNVTMRRGTQRSDTQRSDTQRSDSGTQPSGHEPEEEGEPHTRYVFTLDTDNNGTFLVERFEDGVSQEIFGVSDQSSTIMEIIERMTNIINRYGPRYDEPRNITTSDTEWRGPPSLRWASNMDFGEPEPSVETPSLTSVSTFPVLPQKEILPHCEDRENCEICSIVDRVCPICYEDIQDKFDIAVTNCNHLYCKPCINRHISQNCVCPMCRETINIIKIHENDSSEEEKEDDGEAMVVDEDEYNIMTYI